MTQPSRSLVVLVTGALVAVGTPVLAAPPEPSHTKDPAESRHTVREKEQRAERTTARLRRAKAELAKLGEQAERARKRYDEASDALKRTRKAFEEARQQEQTAEAEYEKAHAAPSLFGTGPTEAAPVERVQPDRAPVREAHAGKEQVEDVRGEDGRAGRTAPEEAGRESSPDERASRYLRYPAYTRYAARLADAVNAQAAEAAKAAEEAERSETDAGSEQKTQDSGKTENSTSAANTTSTANSASTENTAESRRADVRDTAETTNVRQFARLEKLEAVRAKAVERSSEARRVHEDQKTEFAAARKAKNEADKAYEEQKAEVAKLRKLKKRLVSAVARSQNGVVFLADRGAESTKKAVARLKKGKNRQFSRGAARGRLVVQSALKWIGTPYSWGGGNASGPSYGIGRGARTRGFDCSGLALYAWAQAGVKLDHYTGSQWNSGPRIPLSMLSPGDLVFFAGNVKDPDTIHHVGIFVGRGRMVEAPYTGARVRISSMWRKSLIGAVRPA